MKFNKKMRNAKEEYLYDIEQYISIGRKQIKNELLQAAENGKPINLNGRAWFLKSDIQNLRDIFEDLESEVKERPVMRGFEVLKQLFIGCAANLMFTDIPPNKVANDILKYLVELDKYMK